MILGAGLSIVGFIKDKLTEADYSKWMYFAGSACFFMFTIFPLDALNIGIWQDQLLN